MKRLRTLLERLPGGHRPPTGPLTTAEKTEAEELRQETLVKETSGLNAGKKRRGVKVPPYESPAVLVDDHAARWVGLV